MFFFHHNPELPIHFPFNINMLRMNSMIFNENRSLEQNDMFHAWCGTISDKTGHSKAEIKDILVETVFGTEEYLNLQGEKRSRLRQTSSLNKSEMSELIERSVRIGIELGADIPEVKYE